MQQSLRTIFLLVVLAGGLQFSKAQNVIGFQMPFYNNAMTGQILDFPVTVENFDGILSVQYVIRWDPSVLQFQTINGYNAALALDSDNFGLTEVDSGIVRLVWWDSGPGVTLPDGVSMFTLKLKVIGASNTSSDVYFTQITPNTFFEVVNNSNQAFGIDDVNLDNGFVAVGFVMAAEEAFGQANFSVHAAPNPIEAGSEVWIDAETACDAVCTLTDVTGKIIFTKKISLVPGKNGMEIAKYILGQQGTWYLTVRTPNASRMLTLLSF